MKIDVFPEDDVQTSSSSEADGLTEARRRTFHELKSQVWFSSSHEKFEVWPRP